ncbi:unnamed protein product [Durusdinium trenchii]|uniref:Transmembrane protein 18 n=1 Tax=Durusdinium trenchii TaxID=1381693 RepID=A0ABP0SCZ7_9DINO
MEGLNFSASEWLGAVEDVLKSHLTGENRYTQSFTEDVQAFVHAIDWRTDFWIFGLFLVEFLDLLMVVINRRSWERLAMIFLANTGILYCAEWLNQLASKNWKTFSSQDYFDKADSICSAAPFLYANSTGAHGSRTSRASEMMAVKVRSPTIKSQAPPKHRDACVQRVSGRSKDATTSSWHRY